MLNRQAGIFDLFRSLVGNLSADYANISVTSEAIFAHSHRRWGA